MFMRYFLEIKFADIRLISLEHVTYIYIYIIMIEFDGASSALATV